MAYLRTTISSQKTEGIRAKPTYQTIGSSCNISVSTTDSQSKVKYFQPIRIVVNNISLSTEHVGHIYISIADSKLIISLVLGEYVYSYEQHSSINGAKVHININNRQLKLLENNK